MIENALPAPQPVTFPSHSPILLSDAENGHGEAERIEARAKLFLPQGEVRNRPAVVIAHGLGGQKPERELTYGAKLAAAGVVALAIDSFATRGLAEVKDSWRAFQISTWSILADVFGALRFLAAHPAVNADAISVMGFSWGGMAAILAAYEQIGRAYLEGVAARFAGHVAYYGCSIPRLEDPTTAGAPVLIMIGKHDANVSVERTRQIASDLRRGGSEVALRVFDAYHQWDGKDEEMRHVFGALADLDVTITRDNEILEERWGTRITGFLGQALLILRDLRWEGYDILRDDAVHRVSDRLLLDFIAQVARRHGAEPPEADRVVDLGQHGPLPPPRRLRGRREERL